MFPAIIPATTPNFSPFRRAPIRAIIIHVTGAATGASTLSWFANPAAEVSAHYLVDSDGARVWQFVKDDQTAWHSGITWPAMQALRLARPDLDWLMAGTNPNDMTLGIEHVGIGDVLLSAAQMATSAALIQSLCAAHSIPIDRQHIVGHHEIYSGHACPGACDIDALVALAASDKS